MTGRGGRLGALERERRRGIASAPATPNASAAAQTMNASVKPPSLGSPDDAMARRDARCRDLGAEGATERPHDRIHRRRDAGLLLGDCRHDQVRERAQSEADTEPE